MAHNHSYYSVTHLEDIVITDINVAREARDAVNKAIKSSLHNHSVKHAVITSVDDIEDGEDIIVD